MKASILVWTALLILPLLPVTLLYLLFRELNYFELTDTARGVATTGPIAAYIAVVWFGSRLFEQVVSITPVSVRSLRKLRGAWDFESKSSNNTLRKGTCDITLKFGLLEVAGTFSDAGRVVGSWNSVMTRVEENRMYMVYTLTEGKDGREELSRGVSTLSFDSSSITSMTGQWSLVGRESRLGSVTFTRSRAVS